MTIDKKTYPTFLIAITYRCQCSCVHCGAALSHDPALKEMSGDEIKDVIDQSAAIGAGYITFFGGEPLIRKDVLELIRHATEKSVPTSIDTNGFLLTSSFVKQLHQAGLCTAGVSIDSPDPERHDQLRGVKGLFNKAVKGIEYILREGMQCYISTYASKESVHDGSLLRLIELGKELDVSWIRICAPFSTGKWLKDWSVQLNEEERKYVEDLSDSKFIILEDYKHCDAMQKGVVYISAYGDVQPCCYVPVSFGNIRDEPLATIVDKMYCSNMYKKYGSIHRCPMNDECFRKDFIDMVDDHPLPCKRISK